MVERLYGVMHGRSLNVAGMRVADFEAKPGSELTKELLTLPPNTSVGIEHTPELETTFEIDGVSLATGVNSNYWREIERICKSRRLNVIHLEDFETYKKYCQKLLEKKMLDEENLEKFIRFRKDNPDATTAEYKETKEAKTIIRKAYRTSIEAEYIFTIEREQKMLDKIVEFQPQVAILGKGHADLLMLKKMTSKKIPLGEYKTEEIIFVPWHEESDGSPSGLSRLNTNPLPDKSELLERELLRRRYRAVTKGRVMAKGNPDYIGTWDLTIPARGLFEIYLDKKNNGMTGQIEDALGTATLVGVITEKKVIFAKNYKMNKSSSDAERETIAYQGDGSNGLYIGQFKVASGFRSDREMPFCMRKFSPSTTLNLS